MLSELLPPARIAELAVTCERAPDPADLNAVLCAEFIALARRRPLLVAVDDLHWADPWTRRWFADLAVRVDQTAILLLGSAHGPLERVVGVPAGALMQLHLPELTDQQAQALLATALGRPVGAAVARSANEAGMGRPAILASLAEHCAATELPLLSAQLPGLHEVVRAAWSERVSRVVRTLPLDAVALLRAMAVGGGQARFEMVAALARPRSAGVRDALESLADAGLVVGGAEPRLACPAFAVDASQGRDAAERAALSMRAAELGHQVGMGALTIAELLAGVPVAGSRWVGEVHAEAAELLLGQGRRGAAVGALRRALREPLDDATRSRLLIRLASLEVVDQPEASDGRLRQVLIRHVGPDSWDSVVAAADLLLSRGDAETARRVVADAHREAATWKDQHSDAGVDLAPLAALGWLAQDEAGPDLETPATGLPAPARDPHSPAEAAVLAWQLATRAENRPRVLDLARRSLAGGRATPLMCRYAAARALLAADAYEEAADGYREVLTDARASGARAAAAQILLAFTGIELRRGDPEQALAGIEAAKRELPLASWHPALACRVTAAEIMARIRSGKLDSARRLADLPDAPMADRGVGWSQVLYARAEVLMASGEPTRALVLFEECGRVLSARGWRNPVLVPWRFGASLAHQLLGDTDRAVALRAEEIAVLDRWGVGDAMALPEERALAAFREIGLPIPEFPREQRPARLAALPAGPAELAALTPAERQVVDLVLAGHANGEAAARLGVTRRTVELRLTKVYRKLGVTGRDELVRRVGALTGDPR